MKLIIGLGNPGERYEKTRHNVGFLTIDKLATQHNILLNKTKFKGLYGLGTITSEKVILLKPFTYMNLSGECIRPLMDYYQIKMEDMIVVYDDLDMPVGKIRLRTKGSAGGHNGLKSMIHHLGTQNFNRIRIGVDRPKHGEQIIDYVLGQLTKDEVVVIEEAINKSALACEKWLSTPFIEVMNEFN